VGEFGVVDDGDHDDRHVDAMRERAQLLDQLDAVELGQLVVGEDDIDAVVARELQRARRRVEELEVQLAVDLADDLGQQQAAREQVVDDQDGVALGARERELRDGAGRRGRAQRGRWRHGKPSLKRGAESDSSKYRAAARGAWWAAGPRGTRPGRGTEWSGREDSNFRPPAPHAG